MSPIDTRRRDDLTIDEQEKIFRDSYEFRRWLYQEHQNNRNEILNIHKYGCDANRQRHVEGNGNGNAGIKTKWFSISNMRASDVIAVVCVIAMAIMTVAIIKTTTASRMAHRTTDTTAKAVTQ